MSSNEFTVDAGHIERLVVAEPGDTAFWDSVEMEAEGRYALVLGSLDDAIVLPGRLDELDRVADLIKRRVTEKRFVVELTAMREANVEAQRLMDEANDTGSANEEMDVRAEAGQRANEAAELAAELLGADRNGRTWLG